MHGPEFTIDRVLALAERLNALELQLGQLNEAARLTGAELVTQLRRDLHDHFIGPAVRLHPKE